MKPSPTLRWFGELLYLLGAAVLLLHYLSAGAFAFTGQCLVVAGVLCLFLAECFAE